MFWRKTASLDEEWNRRLLACPSLNNLENTCLLKCFLKMLLLLFFQIEENNINTLFYSSPFFIIYIENTLNINKYFLSTIMKFTQDNL